MAQMQVKLEEHEDRVLNVIKGKYGFKNKADAVRFVIGKFEQELLEPELRPEYVKKLERIRKQKGYRFKDRKGLRKHIENART